jgi:hypothetical protein
MFRFMLSHGSVLHPTRCPTLRNAGNQRGAVLAAMYAARGSTNLHTMVTPRSLRHSFSNPTPTEAFQHEVTMLRTAV